MFLIVIGYIGEKKQQSRTFFIISNIFSEEKEQSERDGMRFKRNRRGKGIRP